MPNRVNMAAPIPASPLFLTEPEIRRGIELLYFGNAQLTRSIDQGLSARGLGRAHHRALYFIARQPDLSVTQLIRLLAVTKQSLGRVVGELVERGLVETRNGERDRRQRLLRLTDAGKTLESELFESLRARMGTAYASAGQLAVGGFWAVLEGLIPEAERTRIAALRR